MATNPVIGLDKFPPAAASRVAAALLNRHSAGEIAEAVTVLIDVLDLMGGDPDLETQAIEDDFTPMPSGIDFGPGCEISDAAEEDDDPGQCTEDEASSGNPFFGMRGPGCTISDPAEDDDHAGGNVTDEPHDPEGDYDSGECLPGGGSGFI